MFSHVSLPASTLAVAALAAGPLTAGLARPAAATAAPPPKPPAHGAHGAPVAVTRTSTRVRADRAAGRVSFTFV
jgi:hypothetical protein